MSVMGRWLVREEWKPLAGSSITVFSATTAAKSMPDGGWDVDTVQNSGYVQGEVIGFARVESNTYLGHHDSQQELRTAVEEFGTVLYWEEGHELDTDDAGDAETDASDESDPDDAGDDEPLMDGDTNDMPIDDRLEAHGIDVDAVMDKLDALDDDDDAVTCVHCGADITDSPGHCPDCDEDDEDQTTIESQDGVSLTASPEFIPAAEPTDEDLNGQTVYRLTDQADEKDLSPEVIYEARVNNIKDYGTFVSLNNPPGTDVSGLVHKSNLPFGRFPRDYQVGDKVYVTLLDLSDKGLDLDMVADERGDADNV